MSRLCLRLVRLGSVLLLIVAVLFLRETATAGSPPDSRKPEPLTLQLSWLPQFQFAGYYAALEKGFYRQAGLEVTIVPGGSLDKRPIPEVLAGRADFGIARAELLYHRLQGNPLVALGVIFQHSASVFLTTKDSGINTPQMMAGHRLMLLPGYESAEYLAVLLNEGIAPEQLEIIPTSFKVEDLVAGRTDVFNAYITNEPYLLDRLGIPFKIIKPLSYGIDFYGDTLFTSEDKLAHAPEQVKRFRQASIMGWQYAMEHVDELVTLLRDKFGVAKSEDHLRYEASTMRPLILPDLVEIGHMNPGRWQAIAGIYADLGLVKTPGDLAGFLYDPESKLDLKQIYRLLWGGLALLFMLILLSLLFLNRRLKIQVQKRTSEIFFQEVRFREIFNNINSCIALYKPLDNGRDFVFQDINPAGLASSQLPKEKIVQRKVMEVFPKIAEIGLLEVFRKVWETGVAEYHPTTLYQDDRIELWVENYVYKLPTGDLIAVYNDVTSRKKAEQELMMERERLAVTLQSIGDGVLATDMEGRVLLLNREAQRLTGWSEAEVAGRRVSEIMPLVNEKNNLPIENPALRVLAEGQTIGLLNHTLMIARDGRRVAIADSAAPIRDANDRVVGSVLVFRDVTEKRRFEQERLKMRKLESVGLLAGGIAHDFNNILAIIMGNLSLARSLADPRDELYELLEESEKASLRAKNLTQQLLTFSKGGEPVKQSAAIDRVIRDSAAFVLSGSNVSCEFDFASDLWPAEIDPGQISQVIQNLIMNAAQAMPSGGKVAVTASNRELKSESGLPLAAGRYVELRVRDQGIGIPAAVLENVFDPYFTTKQKGSGLGLAITHSIVVKHQGLITAVSEPGQGSTFTIYLPAATEAPESHANPISELPAQGQGRIMIMDDEERIRAMVRRVLGKAGYEVLEAADGAEAIRLFKENTAQGNPVDLIIMDLTIPGGMGGREAVAEIHRLEPEARVLVSSGYANDPVLADFAAFGFCGMLAKPFQINELKETVCRALRTETS